MLKSLKIRILTIQMVIHVHLAGGCNGTPMTTSGNELPIVSILV